MCRCPDGFHPPVNPRMKSCVRCGRELDPWEMTPQRTSEFFAVLRRALEASGRIEPDDLDAFIAHARERLVVGEREYGQNGYLDRDVFHDALEEPPDSANYALMENLSLCRDEERGLDGDTAASVRTLMLDGAFHAALSYASFRRAQALHRSAWVPE